MPARTTSLVITALALVQLALGVALIFLPQETAAVLFAKTGAPPVLVSLVGACLFGFGQLNWMTRHNPIGGLYGRPALMANLTHFFIGGLALARASETPGLWGAAAFYLAGAAFYGLLLVRPPVAAARG